MAIDDHSRFAYVEVHDNKRGETCADFLERTFERLRSLGVEIKRVMTDNAKNYTQARVFAAALGEARHLTTHPYRRRANGQAKRFNRNLLNECASTDHTGATPSVSRPSLPSSSTTTT